MKNFAIAALAVAATLALELTAVAALDPTKTFGQGSVAKEVGQVAKGLEYPISGKAPRSFGNWLYNLRHPGSVDTPPPSSDWTKVPSFEFGA